MENYIKTNEKIEKDMQENNVKSAENNAKQKEEIDNFENEKKELETVLWKLK